MSSKSKHNIKEIRKWLRTLEENKWRKRYAVDAKRITHFVNNGVNSTLPESLSRKGDGWTYTKERRLAREFKKKIRDEQKLTVNEDNLGLLLKKQLVKSIKESDASKKAKALGLVSKGYGNWADPKTDKIVAKTKSGQLVPVYDDKPKDDDAEIDKIDQIRKAGGAKKWQKDQPKYGGDKSKPEDLQDFNVFVDGHDEPIKIKAKDEKDAKHQAHQMIQNNKVKVTAEPAGVGGPSHANVPTKTKDGGDDLDPEKPKDEPLASEFGFDSQEDLINNGDDSDITAYLDEIGLDSNTWDKIQPYIDDIADVNMGLQDEWKGEHAREKINQIVGDDSDDWKNDEQAWADQWDKVEDDYKEAEEYLQQTKASLEAPDEDTPEGRERAKQDYLADKEVYDKAKSKYDSFKKVGDENGWFQDDDYPEDETGGPSYANVPKGAKSSEEAKKIQKKTKTLDSLNKQAEEGNGELIDTEYNGSVVWDHGDPNEDTFFAIDGDGETVELDYSDIIRFQNDGEDESMLKSVQESVKESYPSFAKMYQKIKR